MDGSSTDELEGLSWIRHWEMSTVRTRRSCLYSDCGGRGNAYGLRDIRHVIVGSGSFRYAGSAMTARQNAGCNKPTASSQN